MRRLGEASGVWPARPLLFQYGSEKKPGMGLGQYGTQGGEPAQGALHLLLCPWAPPWLGPLLHLGRKTWLFGIVSAASFPVLAYSWDSGVVARQRPDIRKDLEQSERCSWKPYAGLV